MGLNSSRGKEQIQISINHPKFIQSKLLHQFDKQILKTTIPCDEKSFKTWKSVLNQHKDIDHEYLLLPKKYSYKSSGVCATRGQLQIDFDNYPYLLTQQIYNRKGKKIPFTQPQLWYLLYAYLSSKNYLKQKTIFPYSLIGDVRPQNVFINESGQVKFSNLFSWPGQKTNYKKTFDGVITYLSPEDYQLLQLGSMNNDKNEKSQFFSIGFTLISVATLKDNSDCYNIQKQKFDTYEAKKRINAFKCSTIYSELIRAIISSLCSFQQKTRISFQDIWQWIIKYQRRIISKQPFMIEQIPPNINQYVNVLRSDLLTINPESSILSVKSLRSSQAINGISSFKSNDNKTNKEAKQAMKRTSRIVFNAGNDQKVFFSPNNGGYFASQVSSGSQMNNLQSLNSPPKASNIEVHKVMKSPEGFYSPKSPINKSQQFRVFIQYKSPTKQIQKPFSQTIYVGKQGKQQVIVRTQSDQLTKNVAKKDSDSKSQKSQKSNDSNRKNRFIQETMIQIQKKQEVQKSKKLEQQRKEQVIYKKQSPIHQIISEELITNTISEVVSEDVIMPKTNKSQKNQINQVDGNQKFIHQSSQLPKQVQEINSVIIQQKTITQIKRQVQKDKPLQDNFQIAFSIKDSIPDISSQLRRQAQGKKDHISIIQKTIQHPVISENLQGHYVDEYVENFSGIQPVHRDSHKKAQIHDSKTRLEEKSQQGQRKRIEQSWDEGDRKRHEEQRLINEQTHDEGHRVPPKRQSGQSISIKFEIPQRHKNAKPYTTIQELQASIKSVPAYQQLISKLTPTSRSILKKQEPIELLDIQQRKKVQKQINKRIIEAFQNQDILSLKLNIQRVQQQEIPTSLHSEYQTIQTKIQQIQDLKLQTQIQTQKHQIQIEKSQNHQNKIQNQFHQNFQLSNQIARIQHTNSQQIIDNQISSQKQPEQLTPLHESDNQQKREQSKLNSVQKNNDRNILIQEDEVLIQEVSSEYKVLNVSNDRPLIPLGPETKEHEQTVELVQKLESVPNQNGNNGDVLRKVSEKELQRPLQQQKTIQNKKILQSQEALQNQRTLQKQETVAEIKKEVSQQKEKESKELTLIQKIKEAIGEKVEKLQQKVQKIIQQIKKPQSPFQQIQKDHHQNYQSVPVAQTLAQFQNIKLQQNIVIIQNQSKNQSKQIVSDHITQQLQSNNVPQGHKIQTYQSANYQHQVSLGGGSQNQDKVKYNIIQVQDNSVSIQPNIFQQSDIDGQGKFHSRVIENAQNTVIQNVQRILPPQFEVTQQTYNVTKDGHNEIKIEQVSETVVVNPIQNIKQTVTLEKFQSHQNNLNLNNLINIQDPFIKDVIQTNQKLQKLHEEQQIQKRKNQPFVLHDLQKVDQHFVQPLVQKLEAHLIPDSNPQNKSQNIQIKNSQIQFEVIKQVIGVSKDIKQLYEIEKGKVETEEQNQQKVLPLNSKANDLNNIYFSNLQATIQPVPTESQFGNISQIMDINKQFNNTLNAKQINFLEGTTDPKSDQFLKQLMYMSQQGKIQKEDLQRVQMSKQDRQKLSSFMERFARNRQGNVQEAISQFKSSLSKSQQTEHMENQFFNNGTQQGRIHLSVQDKNTLGMIVNKLQENKDYHSFDHLKVNPFDDKQVANYDQSNVEIKYSELKTQIIAGQKLQNNPPIAQPTVNQVKQQSNQAFSHQHKKDIVDEVILINQELNILEKNQNTQGTPEALQTAFDQNASLQVNVNQANQDASANNQFVTRRIREHSQELKAVQVDTPLYEVKSATGEYDILDEVVKMNEQMKEQRISQVKASEGEKSQQQDPNSYDYNLQKKSDNGEGQNLQSIRYQRAYSQPNDFLENRFESVSIGQGVKRQGDAKNTETIVEEIQEEHHELSHDIEANERLLKNEMPEKEDEAKGIIEQIRQINEKIGEGVNEKIQDVKSFFIGSSQVKAQQNKIQNIPEHQQPIEPLNLNKVEDKQSHFKQIKVEEIKTSGKSSPRSSRPRDFLDQVMQINKIFNKEEEKDYYENNKFLNKDPQIVQIESLLEIQKNETIQKKVQQHIEDIKSPIAFIIQSKSVDKQEIVEQNIVQKQTSIHEQEQKETAE